MESQNTQQLQNEEISNNSNLGVVLESDIVSETNSKELNNNNNTYELKIHEDVKEQKVTETTVELPGAHLSDVCLVNGKWVAC